MNNNYTKKEKKSVNYLYCNYVNYIAALKRALSTRGKYIRFVYYYNDTKSTKKKNIKKSSNNIITQVTIRGTADDWTAVGNPAIYTHDNIRRYETIILPSFVLAKINVIYSNDHKPICDNVRRHDGKKTNKNVYILLVHFLCTYYTVYQIVARRHNTKYVRFAVSRIFYRNILAETRFLITKKVTDER